ncbi:MAG TPA: hypothetical protein VGI85_06640 [Chthoniobacterales bacterium]|jgi:hypothetical protein
MKFRLIAFCLTTLLLAFDARAAEPGAATNPSAASLTLKHKSTFNATDTRNPFWPIGWKKPTAHGEGDDAPALLPSQFALTSVTTDGTSHFAILNGKVVQQGQQFGLQMGTQIYQVTVQAVGDGRVILSYEGGQVVVPLRRH